MATRSSWADVLKARRAALEAAGRAPELSSTPAKKATAAKKAPAKKAAR